ncbi:hypothetical protein C8R46DRAFT_1355936 [Mycena filopes]|nr:hypothetical protein C8R46DRAFT_1355936 [Mycena filopes]
MHRCLRIQEILDMILGSLNPDASQDSRTLASLARAAKLFHDPALDILWKTQDTPANLLRCMPSDVFDLGPDSAGSKLRLRRAIVASDWERPSTYMNRVKSFSFRPRSAVVISDVISTLAICLPHDSFFPKLAEIYWSPGTFADFQYIRLFLTPNLVTLRVHSGYSDHRLSLLSVLDRKCPALKNVELLGPNGVVEDSTSMIISAFIRGQHRLERLNIRMPDVTALEYVARMPSLRSLETTLPSGISTSSIPGPLHFTQLKSLTLRSVTVDLAAHFLRTVLASTLEAVAIAFDPCPKGADMALLSTAMASCHSWHSSLTSCTFDFVFGALRGHFESYLIEMGLFTDLACFSRLIRVTIRSWCGFQLDDAALDRITKAWPLLEHLSLEANFWGSGTTPTLQCLLRIAKNCPRLTDLTLTLDAGLIHIPTEPVVAHTSLTWLDVAHSTVSADKTLPVARFISRIFPNLRTLHTAQEDEDNDDDHEDQREAIALHRRWKEVETLIPVLAAVREEGRLSAQMNL